MLTVFTCSTTLAGVYKSPSSSTLNASTQDDGVLRNTQAVCTLALPQSSWELRAGPDKQTSRSKATLTAAIPSAIQEPRRRTVIQYRKGRKLTEPGVGRYIIYIIIVVCVTVHNCNYLIFSNVLWQFSVMFYFRKYTFFTQYQMPFKYFIYHNY